jgi:CubicO group peptidase (beta-lactamase class C family)
MRKILFYSFCSLISFLSCQDSKLKTVIKKKEKNPSLFHPVPKDFLANNKFFIDSFFENRLNHSNFNGLFLIAKNGEIVYEKYSGFNHLDKKRKNKHNTPVHLASISKIFTAVAVLKYVEKNKIKLDGDVRLYLPEFPYPNISVRMLLNHRSGVPYYGYFTGKTWDKNSMLRNKDVLNLIIKHEFPLYFEPDSKFSYCNTNYALLALILERVTKQKFPQLLQQLIFEPLGMKNSFILDYDSVALNELPQSYDYRMRPEEFTFLDAVYGDKNMYSTPRDLFLFDKMLYDTTFLSQKMQNEMFKGYSYEREGKKNYGLGWRMVEETGKKTYLFHTGWWHGNTGCFTHLNQDTVCIIALSNKFDRSVFNVYELTQMLDNYPFENQVEIKRKK